MYKYIFIIILLLPILSNSQATEVYLDEENQTISKEEYYKNFDKTKYLYSRFDLDTTIVNLKTIKQVKGSISKPLLDSIKNGLNKQGKETLTENQTIVIRYYTTIDDCYIDYKNNLSQRYFDRKIKRAKNTKHVYVLSRDKDFEEKVDKIWHSDPYRLIEKNFFPLHYICGSYLIIDPQGNYYTSRGEYNPKSILDQINPKTGALLYIEELEAQRSQ
jgi:hypothetical protein